MTIDFAHMAPDILATFCSEESIAALGITRSLADPIAQLKFRALTGETLLVGQSVFPKSNAPSHARKALKAGFSSL